MPVALVLALSYYCIISRQTDKRLARKIQSLVSDNYQANLTINIHCRLKRKIFGAVFTNSSDALIQVRYEYNTTIISL